MGRGSVALCPLVAAIDERNGDIEIGGTFSSTADGSVNSLTCRTVWLPVLV